MTKMKWLVIPICLVSTLAYSDDNATGEIGSELSEYKQYRIFPFVDKGVRASESGALEVAEINFRKALEIAPDNLELNLLLAEVLFRSGKVSDAIGILQRFGALSEDSMPRLLAAFEASLNASNSKDVKFALETLSPGFRKKLIATIANREFSVSGPDSAVKFIDTYIKYIEGDDRVEIHAINSAYKELVKDWRGVLVSLGHVRSTRPLSDIEASRYGMALVELDKLDALEDFLHAAVVEGSGTDFSLRRAAIQRALSTGNKGVALANLKSLAARDRLAVDETEQFFRLLIEAEEYALAESYIRTSGKDFCPSVVSLYVEFNELVRARDTLGQCVVDGDSARWLDVAINLRAEKVLRRMKVSGEYEIRRLRALVNIYVDSGRYGALVSLLTGVGTSSLSPDLLIALAESQEKINKESEAADTYLLVLRRDIDALPNSYGREILLDKATYLYIKNRHKNLARQALGKYFPFSGFENVQLLNERLMSLLPQQPEQSRKQILLEMFGQPFGDEYALTFADLWKTVGNCAELTGKVESERRRRSLLILGRCYEQGAPGLATHYYGLAESEGAKDISIYKAYTYHYAGEYKNALESWRKVPSGAMTDEYAGAAAKSALATGDYGLAEQWWQQAGEGGADWWFTGAMVALGNGDDDLSLERLNQAIARTEQVNSRYLYARAVLLRERGDIVGARADEKLLAEAADLTSEQYAHLAFSSDSSRSQSSVQNLQKALGGAPEQGLWREQLVYQAEAEGNTEEAAEHLKMLVDRFDPDLPPLGTSEESITTKAYNFRRMHERLTRRSQLNVAAWYGNDSGAVGSGAIYGNLFDSKGVQVSYDRLIGDASPTNGGSLSAYGRALVSDGTDGQASSSSMFGVGLRWKPPVTTDLNFFAEINQRDFDGYDQNVDLMLRASGNLLSSFSDVHDWHIGRDSWFVQQLYLDGAYWVSEKDYALLARYSAGPEFKSFLDSPSTIQPYGFLQFDRSRSDFSQVAVGEDVESFSFGGGVAFYLWGNMGKYDAYRNSYSLKIEYQEVVDSNYFAGDGIFLKLEVNL